MKDFELTEVEKQAVAMSQEKMVKALLTVPPPRLRLLARWFEQSEFVTKEEGTDVQDDLRRMADLSEEALKDILNNKKCILELE